MCFPLANFPALTEIRGAKSDRLRMMEEKTVKCQTKMALKKDSSFISTAFDQASMFESRSRCQGARKRERVMEFAVFSADFFSLLPHFDWDMENKSKAPTVTRQILNKIWNESNREIRGKKIRAIEEKNVLTNVIQLIHVTSRNSDFL